MKRSAPASGARRLPEFARPGAAWFWAALFLLAAIGASVLVAELLMSPPSSELLDLTGYLALSGVLTMAAGWGVLAVSERLAALSMQARSLIGVGIATTVAMFNVFITAQLMFVSTAHDLQLLIALLVFSAILTVFFSTVVTASIARRLRSVAGGIRSLTEGRYAERVEVPGSDEVARLAGDLNELARRLQLAEQQRESLDRERRELTAAISHDIRTPLSSVRAMVEALDDQVVTGDEEVQRYYGTIRREIDRLGRMMDDLFELARLDSGALKLERFPVALPEIAAEVVDAMQAQAAQREVLLEVASAPGLPDVEVDGARIERAIANLVRNAIEHTPSGGRVRVEVLRNGSGLAVRVSDSGEGIEEGDLPYIWQRFYRAEKSRRRDSLASDGAGLGLAIVKGIVEAHGGRVAVSAQPGQGSSFELNLPAH